MAEKLMETKQELLEKVKMHLEEEKGKVETYIQKKPISSVLIAAGAGMMLGALMVALKNRK